VCIVCVDFANYFLRLIVVLYVLNFSTTELEVLVVVVVLALYYTRQYDHGFGIHYEVNVLVLYRERVLLSRVVIVQYSS
jgi:hypothetical protein